MRSFMRKIPRSLYRCPRPKADFPPDRVGQSASRTAEASRTHFGELRDLPQRGPRIKPEGLETNRADGSFVLISLKVIGWWRRLSVPWAHCLGSSLPTGTEKSARVQVRRCVPPAVANPFP